MMSPSESIASLNNPTHTDLIEMNTDSQASTFALPDVERIQI
jgi:hypothetical protein